MKFPHLNLLFFIALLAFTSCEKEAVALPEPELTEDASIGMRCCDDAVADMLADPRFTDFYDGFTTGVFDPITSILDQYDTVALEAELEAFNACLESGNSYDYCVAQSDIISQIIDVLSSYDPDLLNSLLDNYSYIDYEDLTNVIIDAINQSAGEEGRKLTCFMQFQDDIMEITMAGGIASLGTGGLPAAIGIIIGIVAARYKFCRCLYSKYGKGC